MNLLFERRHYRELQLRAKPNVPCS